MRKTLPENTNAVTNFIASDSIAILCTGNAISRLPVFLDPDGEPFVKLSGHWVAADGLSDLVKYEKIPTPPAPKVQRRKLFNTATGKMVEV